MLKAVVASQIATAKLTLEVDQRQRTLAAALESVFIVSSQCDLILSMVSAAQAYDAAVKGVPNHPHGAPDFWKLKVLMQSLCADTGLSMAAQLAPLAHGGFKLDELETIATACTLKKCSDDHKSAGKRVLVIQFTNLAGGILAKAALTEYLQKAGAEFRRGRAPRGPLARSSQLKLDDLQKLLKPR